MYMIVQQWSVNTFEIVRKCSFNFACLDVIDVDETTARSDDVMLAATLYSNDRSGSVPTIFF